MGIQNELKAETSDQRSFNLVEESNQPGTKTG
jgi:hypothetical protein